MKITQDWLRSAQLVCRSSHLIMHGVVQHQYCMAKYAPVILIWHVQVCPQQDRPDISPAALHLSAMNTETCPLKLGTCSQLQGIDHVVCVT
jgi:hypothetical protein